MHNLNFNLPVGKKLFFASDFHLGAPNEAESKKREKKIIHWLKSIAHESKAIFLVGDVFDFWFEYKHVVPKGQIRLLAQLAEMVENGIEIHLFHGNHDMWMKDYLINEIGVRIHSENIVLESGEIRILIGHGDGLGPGDSTFKFLKRIFRNRMSNFAFKWLHPDIGVSLARKWSNHSRASSVLKDESFQDKEEHLFQYCLEKEAIKHHDYYVFGHRHLALDMAINDKSRYINLGEWINNTPFAEFDGKSLTLKKFEG